MRLRSIRSRLTVWYFVVLTLGFTVFGIGNLYAMRASIFHAVDDGLRDRIRGVEKFMNEQIASLSPKEIRDEFREHSVLGPGGDLFQVCTESGEWLYRSLPLENNRFPIRRPSQLGNDAVFENTAVQNTPIRFASRRVIVAGQPYTVQVAAPLPEFYEALEQFRWLLLFSVPALLLIASAGGYWISSRALEPVEEIRATARSLSIQNLSQRLAVPDSGDELQRLSETLNEMLGRIGDSVRRISQFTADASHELRAPVSLIRSTAELAVQGGRTNEEYHKDMKLVLAEAQRTSQLIDSLLLLARADSGDDGLHKERMDWSLSIREAIHEAQKLATGKRIEIHSDLPSQSVPVEGDSDALRRLVFILLDNAVKYSLEAGTVSLSLRVDFDEAVCTVKDTGIGIAPDDIPRVFDRFWRADNARSRGGGAGLGLSIAKWIVDRHEGHIEVRSISGQGSEFVTRVPIRS